MRPAIGITTRPRVIATSGGDLEAHTLQRTYSDSVLRGGGMPVLLAPVPVGGALGVTARMIRRHPLAFLKANATLRLWPIVETPVLARDAFFADDHPEARRAAIRRVPMLAICRGMQVVNVALGGTLIEDIPTEIGSMDHTVLGHQVFNGHQHVTLEPGCRLAAVVGGTDLEVNSIHHQAVRDLAPGLRAVAWADDGVIEAVQHQDAGWPLLAVQWHPEYLGQADDKASWALFHALVDAAAG